MLFVISCEDKPDSLALRLANRDAHLHYLENFSAQVVMAGPYLNADNQPIGSMLIVEFPNEADAVSFSENDPYNRAGLFKDVFVRPWKKTVPA
ncbi:MAG: YciI family protein [Halieaceae bacterium]|jgi:uncharacterized protein YciI